jgi:hypothetical protein
MSVICVIWYKIFTVFQNYSGARPLPLAPSPSVRHCFSSLNITNMKVQANCNNLVGLDEKVKTQLFLRI